jgi:hypothetical protein
MPVVKPAGSFQCVQPHLLFDDRREGQLLRVHRPGMVKRDKRRTALPGSVDDAGTHEIIDAHAIRQPHPLIFQGHVVKVIVPAEEALCGAQLFCRIEQLSGIFGAADGGDGFSALSVFSKIPDNLVALLQPKIIGGSILRQRYVEKRQRGNRLTLLGVEAQHLAFIPVHLIVVNIVVYAKAFADIVVGIEQEKRGAQSAVLVSDLNNLIVVPVIFTPCVLTGCVYGYSRFLLVR